MHPVEFTWFKILVLLTAGIGIGFGIYNIYLFNKMRTKGNCSVVSHTQTLTALWFNIILVFFCSIIFLWSLFRLIFSGEMKKEVVNQTYNTHYHRSPDVSVYSPPLNYDPSTYVSPSAVSVSQSMPVSQLSQNAVPVIPASMMNIPASTPSPSYITTSPSYITTTNSPILSSISTSQQYW